MQNKYLYNGLLKNYIPDFLIRLNNDVTLVLEVKGKDSDQNKEKRRYLAEWVDAVNEDGNYGIWASDVILDPAEIRKVIEKHTNNYSVICIRRSAANYVTNSL